MSKTYVIHITTDNYDELHDLLSANVEDFELVAEFGGDEEEETYGNVSQPLPNIQFSSEASHIKDGGSLDMPNTNVRILFHQLKNN